MAIPARELPDQLELPGVILHQPDSEPTRSLCPHCLAPVIRATVKDEPVIAELWEWLPLGECLSCAHTRHSHPGSKVDCNRCNGTALVGERRPPGEMLAIDVGWADDLHLRLIGPNTDRRRGEALHKIHVCQDRHDS